MWSSTVDDHWVDPDIFQEDDIEGEVPFQGNFLHRAPAILDHNGLVIESPDVGEGFDQYLGLFNKILHRDRSSL